MTNEKLEKAKTIKKNIDEIEVKIKNINTIFDYEDKELDFLRIRHDKASCSIYIPVELRKVFKTLLLQDAEEKLNKLLKDFGEL